MFTKKSKSTSPGTLAVSASIISDGTCITGNLESNGDVRVDGVIKGNVYCKAKVLIGPTGFIEGNIHCQEADIAGQVTGAIITQGLLVLKGNAAITGDIQFQTIDGTNGEF